MGGFGSDLTEPFATVEHGFGEVVLDRPHRDAQLGRDSTVAFAQGLVKQKHFAAALGKLHDGSPQDFYLLPALCDGLWRGV